MARDPAVELLATEWASIAELCRTFGPEDWQRPTDCPGWTVQDQLSHLVGPEVGFLGRERPAHTPADTSHVKNPIGQANEADVDYRRSWPPEKVLAEFEEVTAARIAQLDALGEEGLAAESWTPTGPGTVRDLLAIRAFDAWVHEQDMRRATGRPGHLEGPVAEHSVGRCALAMPFVVGKKAGAPDGATVVFAVEGDAGRTIAIGVEGGRARPLDEAPDEPTVRLTMDVETFTCLGNGRWDPDATLAEGRVRIDGDGALGEAVVRAMAFMI